MPLRPSCQCNMLSVISGLFNLRGNDIPFNPFFYSYTLLTFDKIWQVDSKYLLNFCFSKPVCGLAHQTYGDHQYCPSFFKGSLYTPRE